MRTPSLVVLFALCLAACTAEPAGPLPPAFAQARATRTCGPADGPAVAIYLAGAAITAVDPPAPFIRVALWQGISEITRQDWPLADTSSLGSAWYFPDAASPQATTGGTLHISSIGTDSSVTGTITVDFPGIGRVSGGFHAPWLSRTVLCG